MDALDILFKLVILIAVGAVGVIVARLLQTGDEVKQLVERVKALEVKVSKLWNGHEP